MAIAFYFLIFKPQQKDPTEEVKVKTDGFNSNCFKKYGLGVRGHVCKISSGLRAFCKEISLKFGEKKISG